MVRSKNQVEYLYADTEEVSAVDEFVSEEKKGRLAYSLATFQVTYLQLQP